MIEALNRAEPPQWLYVSIKNSPQARFLNEHNGWVDDVYHIPWDGIADPLDGITTQEEQRYFDLFGIFDWRGGALQKQELHGFMRMDGNAVIIFGADPVKDRDALINLVSSDQYRGSEVLSLDEDGKTTPADPAFSEAFLAALTGMIMPVFVITPPKPE